jgi:dGTPase
MPLAPYAAHPEASRGRAVAEAPPTYRSEYQRDRDRIIHSAAFRRLEYKTQVFVNHEGDLYRTRLTHSLEVAQIARTIARTLGLNEDLAEAICLAHDLGHTPFGHAGQDALDACMKPWGGFEHNVQSLRVVDVLEDKYAAFPGLNLTFETREGLIKHCSKARAATLGAVAARFVTGGQPVLEAQVANLADEIAYNNHDIDDGVRAQLLTLEALCEVPLVREHRDAVLREHPRATAKQLRHETVRRLIGTLVGDLTEHSRAALAAAAPADADAVRAHAAPLIGYSEAIAGQNRALKRHLREQLYQHPQVYRVMQKAKRVLRELFAAYMDDPQLLPPQACQGADLGHEAARAQVVADYIAGMTDRFAIDEWERLFDPRRLK